MVELDYTIYSVKIGDFGKFENSRNQKVFNRHASSQHKIVIIYPVVKYHKLYRQKSWAVMATRIEWKLKIRIPTVKLKIPGNFVKVGCRTSVTFKFEKTFFTFFHGCGLVKFQPLQVVDS